MSKTIEIAMPDDVFLGMRKSPRELAFELRLAAAVKWYETGMVSQGKAAEISGLSRAGFIAALARFSVSPRSCGSGRIERLHRHWISGLS